MLAIRMQRTGRKGSASFRIIVQDSRFSPKSGRVVARVGHFNPHTKEKSIDVDKVTMYLEKGAQPTPRVVRLLTAEKVKMPKWVLKPDNSKKSKTKNATKLRKNQPKEERPEEVSVETESIQEKSAEESVKAEEKPAVVDETETTVKESSEFKNSEGDEPEDTADKDEAKQAESEDK